MTSSLLLLLQRSDVGPFWTVRSTASPLQLKPFLGEIKIYRFSEIFIFRQVLRLQKQEELVPFWSLPPEGDLSQIKL